jgi:hypothetical protein
MLIIDVSEVKLPGEAIQNNLPLECGQPIDGVKFDFAHINNGPSWIYRLRATAADSSDSSDQFGP